jgi:hypothetical protein
MTKLGLIGSIDTILVLVRWKERYVVLSPDTLYTYKKAVSSISEKGQFVMKVPRTLHSWVNKS